MKTLAVFAAILAVSFGGVIRDNSLKDDLLELQALLPMKEISELIQYYYVNDVEFAKIVSSKDFMTLNNMFNGQPEVVEFTKWVQEQLQSEYPENVEQIDLKIHNNYKPGWRGFMEAYIDLIIREDLLNFVEEKVAEGGIFAEFWSRLRGLRVAYERVIRLPEFVKALRNLEALGFDGQQYDAFIRVILGWH